jgi:hypothetical protein
MGGANRMKDREGAKDISARDGPKKIGTCDWMENETGKREETLSVVSSAIKGCMHRRVERHL